MERLKHEAHQRELSWQRQDLSGQAHLGSAQAQISGAGLMGFSQQLMPYASNSTAQSTYFTASTVGK